MADLAASPDGIVVDPKDASKYLGLVEISAPKSVPENIFDVMPIGESTFGIWMSQTNCYRHMIITIKYKDNSVPPTWSGVTLSFGVPLLS